MIRELNSAAAGVLVCGPACSLGAAEHGGNTWPRRQQRKFHRKNKSKITDQLHSRQMSWHSLSSKATLMALTSRAPVGARTPCGHRCLPGHTPVSLRRGARLSAFIAKNIHCTEFAFRVIFLSRGYIVGRGTEFFITTAG